MPYFNQFPYIEYSFPNDENKMYKNISIRPGVADALMNDYTNLEIYFVEDGETPETIAYDRYEDASMHWVIMLANNIMNLYKDWPMSESTLNDYLKEKYRVQKDSDGIERTLNDIQVSEYLDFVGLPENNYTSEIDLHDSDNGPKVTIKPRHFIDADGLEYTFDTISLNTDANGRSIDIPNLTPVSYYEYERKLNDEKRKINIPTRSVAIRMQRELGNIVNE